MPLTNLFASPRSELRRLGASALVLAGCVLAAAGSAADMPLPLPALMPLPAEVRPASGRLGVTAGFRVALRGAVDERLRAGVTRALQRWQARTGLALDPAPADATTGAALVIECAAVAPALPPLDGDESYTLSVAPAQATLHAATTIGALRGLETLLQLLEKDGDRFYLPAVIVRDQPRFPWRGLMIDVCRHWQPIEVIKRNLDGMAVVKLNVLHLHLTDDQGFRIESRTHPELQAQGSDGHFFTQAQMREIIAYASARGIRVVPEFDIPGHATSWVVSHPELASAPGPYAIERKWGVFDPVLDPTNEKTYALLADFLGEMADLFPDPCIHIGGDENNGVQWNANARIQAFIREHDLKDNAGLHAYFNRRVAGILRQHGKRIVGWDEILHPDLPTDSVIQSWRGAAALAEAVKLGYSGLLSNGYYIDLNHPASEHYLVDPLPADTTLSPEQQPRVLGGEATMWAEWVTPDNIDTRIWPRTAAIAERFWSPRDVRDVASMYRRLAVIDERLREAGTTQGDWPRIALPGLEPDSQAAHALVALAALVEPVKDYRRGGLQPQETQLSPRDRLADWARPDSVAARIFNSAVSLWLFADGPLDQQKASALHAVLDGWRATGEVAATVPAADQDPIAQARVATAHSLAAISRVGIEAIDTLQGHRALNADQQAQARTALAAAAEPTAAAVEFPFLPSLRLIVAAASEPARRDELSRADWRTELEKRAAPAPAH